MSVFKFLNDETCMVRTFFELKYDLFMISLNKYSGSCNALAPKICVSKETKEISVKAFNMITNKNEAKAMTEHVPRNCKCKFSSATCNSK